MKRTKAIIVDLDGTLSDSKHRQHFMTGDKKDWKSFYENLIHDPIAVWCEQIIFALEDFRAIILVSGRPSEYRKQTEEWLAKHGIKFTRLLMRKSGDFRADYVIKKEIYYSEIEPHFDVEFCIDDRKQVVDMWRSIGLTCLQCAEGNF